MNERKRNTSPKVGAGESAAKNAKRPGGMARLTRSAVLAMSLTAGQLSEEADFFGEKFFQRNLVDRLHSTALTRYHE